MRLLQRKDVRLFLGVRRGVEKVDCSISSTPSLSTLLRASNHGHFQVFRVSRLLCLRRSNWSSVRGNYGAKPVSPPSPGWINVAHKPSHREEVREAGGETHETGGVWVSCASPRDASSAEHLARAPQGGQSRAPRQEWQHVRPCEKGTLADRRRSMSWIAQERLKTFSRRKWLCFHWSSVLTKLAAALVKTFHVRFARGSARRIPKGACTGICAMIIVRSVT